MKFSFAGGWGAGGGRGSEGLGDGREQGQRHSGAHQQGGAHGQGGLQESWMQAEEELSKVAACGMTLLSSDLSLLKLAE